MRDVATMDRGYAGAVVSYLERRAPRLLQAAAWNSMMILPSDQQAGEMAFDILERDAERLWDLAEKSRTDHDVAIRWLWQDRGELMRALVARTVPEHTICPTCGAYGRDRCRTRDGDPTRAHVSRAHTRRVERAIAARRANPDRPSPDGS